MNKRGLTPISYELYREIRAHKTKDKTKPICYKDGKRIKFCCWCGKYDEWSKILKKYKLEEGVHYVNEISHSFRGPYPVLIMYCEE